MLVAIFAGLDSKLHQRHCVPNAFDRRLHEMFSLSLHSYVINPLVYTALV